MGFLVLERLFLLGSLFSDYVKKFCIFHAVLLEPCHDLRIKTAASRDRLQIHMSRCGPNQAIFTQYRHLNLIQNVIGQHLRFSWINSNRLFAQSRQTIPELYQLTALLFFRILSIGRV